MRRAVVDVGSNAVVMAAMEKHSGKWQVLTESSRVTALGEGVRQTGLLNEQAIQRTLRALKDAWMLASELEAVTKAYGTMALRIARNSTEFQARAQEQGTPVTVLSGDQEALLGLLSVATDHTFWGEKVICVDVGGNSTEIGAYDRVQNQPIWHHSFPIGTLGLRSIVGNEELSSRHSLLRACDVVDEALAEVRGAQTGECPTVVAVGATATNLASIENRLERWLPERVHGCTLEYESISRFVGETWSWTDEERASLVGIEAGRESTIHLGALILERALHALGAERVGVSVRGWRHSIIEDDKYWF